MAGPAHPGAANAHAAMHPPWVLINDSAILIDTTPVAANLVTVGKEMCLWLQQKGQLTMCTEEHRGKPFSYTNPYTYYATSISTQIASAINSIIDFSESTTPIAADEAELQRIRLETELKLNFARFCESAIKQMLHCTSLNPKLYQRASMGDLLAFDCKECRKLNKAHFVSLLGALAHRYFLCNTLDSCLIDHLAFVGTRRNKEAAHSDSPIPTARSTPESRQMASEAVRAIGHELGHMAQHIGEIEEKMIREIELRISHFPKEPPLSELLRIGIRFTSREAEAINRAAESD